MRVESTHNRTNGMSTFSSWFIEDVIVLDTAKDVHREIITAGMIKKGLRNIRESYSKDRMIWNAPVRFSSDVLFTRIC